MALDPKELQTIADEVVAKLTQTRQPRTPWDRRWNLVVTALAILSLVFSIGVNWSKVDANKDAIAAEQHRGDRFDDDIRSLRNELSNERAANQVVLAKLDAIQAQVLDVKARFDRAFK